MQLRSHGSAVRPKAVPGRRRARHTHQIRRVRPGHARSGGARGYAPGRVRLHSAGVPRLCQREEGLEDVRVRRRTGRKQAGRGDGGALLQPPPRTGVDDLPRRRQVLARRRRPSPGGRVKAGVDGFYRRHPRGGGQHAGEGRGDVGPVPVQVSASCTNSQFGLQVLQQNSMYNKRSECFQRRKSSIRSERILLTGAR